MMDLSVIIPTFNRYQSLHETLLSLGRQTLWVDRWEVIIVDDGSTDETEAIDTASFPFSVRYIRQMNQGSAVARNTGAAAATGWLLIFVDDDMLFGPDYLAELLEEHRRTPHAVGMGVTLPYVHTDATPFARIYASLAASPETGSFSTEAEFTDCVTNNLSVERRDFHEIGAMHDVGGDGPTWWGDIDFGYRAYCLDYRFRRVGKAVCWHRDHSIGDLSTATRRAYTSARMAVALFTKFPATKRFMPMFNDKGPIDWHHDAPRLIGRKMTRQLAAAAPAVGAVVRLAYLLEHLGAPLSVLRPLYRWIIGSYIFQGYQRGLREHASASS